ncbi:MAG TPA: SDR family oxidoreductase [Polyangiaceae bacterium]|nr:SDR family oxidoreductase [Polyangiaceae bacterium]
MSEVLLVTGGGRGIGAATARLAAQRGYRIALTFARDAERAENVVAEIRAQHGEAISIQADVSVEADVVRLFRTVDQKLGTPRVLVNNAGVVDQQKRVEDYSAERLARMFAVNTIGSILCAREAVRRMSTERGGRGGAIVNVSSTAARIGSPGEYVDYAASKAAIDTFTLGLAKEVASEGIRVNAVRPGIIDTELHASGGDPERAARLSPQIPMGRAGQAEEVARAILWLASDDASYTNGALLDVSGGR